MTIRPDKKWVALVLALLLLAASCAASEDINGLEFEQDCQTQADCASGEVCIEGYCSVEDQEDISLDFRFYPAQGTEYRPQFFRNISVDEQQRLNFGLEPAVTISSGTRGIFFSNGTGGPSGTLIFNPVGVDDSRFRSQVRTNYDDGFQLLLSPGTYTVTFVPDSESLPQKTWRNVEFTNSREFSRRVSNTLSLQRIKGVVTRETEDPVTTIPVSGATVYATARGGQVISTSSVTALDGSYSIYVEPNVGPYDLHVGPSASNALVPSQVFEDLFEATNTGCLEADGSDISCSSFTNYLGSYPRDPVPVSVSFAPSGFDPLGSKVVVRSELLGNTGSVFSRAVTVDSTDGPVEIELIPKRAYEFEVLPPTDSQFASTKTTFVPDPDLDQLSVSVSMEGKKRVRGVLVDSNGSPVAFERVDFTPSALDAANAEEDIDTRTVSTQTDENGEFEVFLEGVRHDVSIQPSAGSGLAITRRSLSAADIRTSGPSDRIQLRLAQPRVLVGSVIGDSGAGDPLSGVTVRAYRTVDGESRLVGEARSDADGSSRGDFRMIISSELR